MHPLGTIRKFKDFGSNNNGEGQFMYVKGVASGVVGSAVTIAADDYSTTLGVAGGKGMVGVFLAALTAGTFGWAQIDGKAVAKVLTGFLDNGTLFLTATAGSLDDSGTATDKLKYGLGASAIDVPATGMAEVELHRAYTDAS